MNKCEKCGEKKSCRNWIKEVVWAVTTYIAASAIGATAAIFGLSPEKIIEKEVQYIVASGVEVPGSGFKAFGWEADPKAVEKVVAGLKHPVFAKTPAGSVVEDELPDHAYQWDMAKKALGRHIPTRDQGSVGSCVSFSSINVVEYLLVAQMVAQMQAGLPPPEFKEFSQECIYAFSRVNVGEGRLRGSDGSVGGWAAEAANKYGLVPRGIYGDIDLSKYNESRCRSYGDNGVPKALWSVAKEHLVKSVSLIRTTDELRHALASRYPVAIASNVGFGNSSRSWVRDSKGRLQASGTWSHAMAVLGYHRYPDGIYNYFIMNSWGEKWVSGPSGPGDPPAGGFWTDERTMQRILDAGDSWVYNNLLGFEVRVLDWFVRNDPPKRLDMWAKLFTLSR